MRTGRMEWTIIIGVAVTIVWLLLLNGNAGAAGHHYAVQNNRLTFGASYEGSKYPTADRVDVTRRGAYRLCVTFGVYVPRHGGGWSVAPGTNRGSLCWRARRGGTTALLVSDFVSGHWVGHLLDHYRRVRWQGSYKFDAGHYHERGYRYYDLYL